MEHLMNGKGSGDAATSDLQCLLQRGEELDLRPPVLQGESVREWLVRQFLKIRDKHGRLVRLAPNRVQTEFARRATRRNIVLKARQLGITTYIAARFFLHTITRPGCLTVQVAHDQSSAEEIFRIVHRFLENLPERLRRGALITSRANVRQLVFPRLDSEYRVETAADPHAGRGLTIHNLHCSEVARWPRDAAATLASLRAALPPGGEIVLESTPNGVSGCFYEEWQHAAETGYTRHFFPWWWEPNYARPGVEVGPLSDDERELVERFGLTAAQIAFRRDVRANFRKFAAEEFAEDPVSCFLASGECVFETDVIARRLAELAVPAEMDTGASASGRFGWSDNGRLATFWPAKPSGRYIIGVDPAGGGTGGDFSCAQVIDRATGLQCAELHGHFPPQELAARLVQLARRYNQALVAVERNNHGHAVLAHLTAVEQYENVYQQNGQPGWLTSAATRPRMIENFAAVLAANANLFYSSRLLQECRTFIRHEDGSASASSGAHDDCVMAIALALAVRSEMAGHVPRRSALQLASLDLR
ncbi:MAG: terminase [Terriglobales bacterium]